MGTSVRVLGCWPSLGGADFCRLRQLVESFNAGKFDLTWTFVSFPQVTGTFKQTITPGEAGNDYLAFTETTAVARAASAFGLVSAAVRSSKMSAWAPR